MIKCRFCEYKIKKWRTSKSGKKIEGYQMFLEHIIMEHPDEYKLLIDRLEQYEITEIEE